MFIYLANGNIRIYHTSTNSVEVYQAALGGLIYRWVFPTEAEFKLGLQNARRDGRTLYEPKEGPYSRW